MSLTTLLGDEFADDIAVVPPTTSSEMTEKILEQSYLGCPENCLLMFVINDWMIRNCHCHSCFDRELSHMIDGIYRNKEIL